MSSILNWIVENWVEVSGTILGILYVFLSIKQNILTWLLGLLTSVLYIYVFFDARFYADMSLQVYYVWISIYGWILWAKGSKKESVQEQIHVSKTSVKQYLVLGTIAIALWIGIYFILKYFTDSPIPVGDAFTTALSIVATWMLARKLIEHWILWVVIDFVSLVLYVYKELYPTAIMFVIYVGAAIWGYFEWKKDLNMASEGNSELNEVKLRTNKKAI